MSKYNFFIKIDKTYLSTLPPVTCKSPVIFVLPTISNFSVGVFVPIPKLSSKIRFPLINVDVIPDALSRVILIVDGWLVDINCKRFNFS